MGDVAASGGSRICQGEGRGNGGGVRTMASARSASLNGGLGAEPLSGIQGQSPWWEVRGLAPIFIQKSGQS